MTEVSSSSGLRLYVYRVGPGCSGYGGPLRGALSSSLMSRARQTHLSAGDTGYAEWEGQIMKDDVENT